MSLENYIKAIETIGLRGETPTLDAIRKEAGGGSFSTITAARRIWQGRKLMPSPALSEEMPAALTACVGEVWRKACELADSNVVAERAALAATRQELEQGQAELCETADRLAAEAERLSAERDILRTERDALRARLETVTAERDASHALLREQLSALLPQGKPAKPHREAPPKTASLGQAALA